MRKLSDEQIAEAAKLRKENPTYWTYAKLARLYRCGDEAMRLYLNPAARAEKRRKDRDGYSERVMFSRVERNGRVSEEEYRAALARIPPDDRDLTSKLMGDPLPGRSALAQRGEQ